MTSKGRFSAASAEIINTKPVSKGKALFEHGHGHEHEHENENGEMKKSKQRINSWEKAGKKRDTGALWVHRGCGWSS